MYIALASLFLLDLSVQSASQDAEALWTTQRKALLRQEPSVSLVEAKMGRPAETAPFDSIEAELQHTAKELQLTPDETAQVISATHAVIPPPPEATNASLRDSVLVVARRIGLSSPQVDRLKLAMANLDHRSYVHILQVLRAAKQSTPVPAKVAAVVTAAAKANYTIEEIGAAAAAATLSLEDGAASTTVPLQGLVDAVGQLGGVEGQAAVVAAAGEESPRSQSVIADMFQAISSTTAPVFQWNSASAHPFGFDPDIVGNAVREEVNPLAIPDQAKSLDPSLAGDLLALASAAFSAGFTDREVAMFKLKWQEMTSQQRAAAKRSFDALASARALAGLRNIGSEGNLSTNVASAVKAFEDAGASTDEVAQVAAEALRITRATQKEGKKAKDKTALQQTMEEVKLAGLSDQQAQAILKVMAGLSQEDIAAVAGAWAAIGDKISAAPASTQAPLPLQEEQHAMKGGRTPRAPVAGMDLQALEELNVVAFAALQVGVDIDLMDEADGTARGMSPDEQMAVAAAIIRQAPDAKYGREELQAALHSSLQSKNL
eukprot:symbB.v1.2.018697.t1/scaffold1410.1/size216244/23